jgi:hypothetical protein
MAKFNTGQSFADGDTVTGAKLNNIVGLLDIYSGVIADQTAIAATVSTADLLLIADTDAGSSGAANKVTVQKLLNDTLTNGTYTNAQLSGALTYGTATGNRTVSTSATITTGTIPNLTSSTATITLGTIPTLTAGTTTSTAANITNGTVQTLTASTATISVGTYSGLINSSTGTFSGSINSTAGTIGTLNSTTGTITNISTTLTGDFTISQGTGTLGTTGVAAGTYGTSTIIPRISVDAKGRITTISTAALGSTGKLLQVVRSTTSSVVTCGTNIPWDDTIPQNTEGNEVLTAAITPLSATSSLYIKFFCTGNHSGAGGNGTMAALFVDSTANAISIFGVPNNGANWQTTISIAASVASSSTTARTYKVRVGSSGGVTFYVNGNNVGTRVFGGVSTAMFEILEVEA